ncbi:endo-1,4-beta-xylanase [Olivibacter sp. XZL3]|uniref:endo-1,4-beta-xylanase n=1 Tax=Olivibacter sp. XZL3 TaxID=1735116 RepID=UPI0010663D0D|nr:endo-1,4-beta-xylanase [Olivibacter sp. XZL3]
MTTAIQLLIGLIMLTACTKSNLTDNENTLEPVVLDTSLRNLSPFPFGAAVNVGLLKNNNNYRQLVVREFNSLTPENAMKTRFIHPQQDTYAWADADYLVDFADEHNMRVHGHTLVWYKNLPDWIINFQGDSIAWEQLFRSHIQTVVSRYKGRIGSWDVVNEALNNEGTGMRPSLWLTKLGPDYIARAFQYAHDADPDALLFYNDYGNEYGPTKRNAIINLVKGLKDAGVPIHGVGMQMHTRVNREDQFHASAITNTATETGLLIHIAELDIAVNPDNNPDLVFTETLAAQQAQKYGHIVETFTGINTNQRFGITTWNVTDGDSWIPGTYNRPDWPLPFDASYQRKPAYDSIIAVFE